MTDKKYTAADIVIDTLKNNGVEYVLVFRVQRLTIYLML